MGPWYPGAFAALTLSTLLLPTPGERARGALGLPAFALGAASVPFLADIRGPEPTLWVSAALLLLGPSLLAVAAWRARTRLGARNPVLLVVLLSVALSIAAAWPTLRLGGVIPALLTAGAISLGSLFLWMVCAMLGVGRAIRWMDARLPLPDGPYSWGALVLVAGALGFGVAALKWPLWIELWQSVGVAVGVLCAWWAVATRRPSLGLAGAAFASAFTVPEASFGGWLVLGVAAQAVRPWGRVAAVIAAAGGFLVAPALLGAEVVYTVLLAGAGTALLAALAAEPLPASSAPR